MEKLSKVEKSVKMDSLIKIHNIDFDGMASWLAGKFYLFFLNYFYCEKAMFLYTFEIVNFS